MPIEWIKVHVNDSPWITPKFKELIRHRQNAFTSGDSVRFRMFRNLVNRGRKILREMFFISKVSHFKQAKPRWSAVKRISGMSPISQDLISQLESLWLRQANVAIKRVGHPIPTLEELMKNMAGAMKCSKIDLNSGYHLY